MKRIFLCLFTLVLWCITASLHAAVWSPTWAWQKTYDHVSYENHSTNCFSDGIEFLDVDEANGFTCRIYDCSNSKTNVGNVNVDIFLSDKVTLEETSSYTFSMKVNSFWNYIQMQNAKVKLQIRDGMTSDSKVLCEMGEIGLFYNTNGSYQTTSVNFSSAPVEGYFCMTFTGEHVGKTYSIYFSDFSIDKITTSVPEIVEQPETSLSIDVDNVPTLSVKAEGDNLTYQWYYQFPGSTWISCGETSTTFTPSYFNVGYKYKCVVSNANGDAETDPISVDQIILHGTEFPEGSGKYYTTYSTSEDFITDGQTVAYKAVWNETKKALDLVHVRQDDACIPRDYGKGLALESTSPDIVLLKPEENSSHTTSYDDNALLDHDSYDKTTGYVFGVKDGKMAMYPGSEDKIPFYEACYKGEGLNTEYPDGVELLLPSQYTIVFDKNAESATGTMVQQTLFDDGNTTLLVNSFVRPKYDFNGWSTSPTGTPEYTDKQLITDIPTTEDHTLTLYAQWKIQLDAEGYFNIGSNDDWTIFCQYIADEDNSLNAKLTTDITTAATYMAGTVDKPYCGTFDGDGHVLTINYDNTTEQATAPFHYTQGATIHDLTVEGVINTSQKFAGGIIGNNMDNNQAHTQLQRCVSRVNIISSVDGNGTHGGLVGVNNYDDMVIEDCAFTGAITQAADVTTTCCGGFIGSSDGTAVIRNSLLAADFSVSTEESNTFVRKSATLSDCYYLSAFGDVPEGATSIDSLKLKSGEALTLLGYNWAQVLGRDTTPAPYHLSKKETTNYIYHDGTSWVCEDFQLKDKEDVNIGLDFTAKALTYNRAFTIDDGYYTVYTPFAIPTTNGYLYTCIGINEDKTEAEFTEVTTPEANTAYIFKPAKTLLDLGNNVEVKKTTDLTNTTDCLRGVYSLFTFTNDNKKGCYGYAAEAKDGYEAGAFVRFGTGATVPAGRAYIYAPAVDTKMLKVVIGGETTGITIPVEGNTSDEGTFYNLSGQRVGGNYKGIVISNGRKIIRK